MLAPEEAKSQYLQPDHRPPIEDMWTQVACHIIMTYRTLDVLSYRASLDFYSIGLPSWVPDFTVALHVVPLTLGVFHGRNPNALFSAGGVDPLPDSATEPGAHLLADLFLELEGTIVAEIAKSSITNMLNLDSMRRVTLEKFLRRALGLQAGQRMAGHQQSIMEIFWRTILAHQRQSGDRLRTKSLGNSIIPPRTEEEHQKLLREPELTDRLPFIKGRNLIITDRGDLGLAPIRVEVGELIVVFPVGAVPYILRWVQGNSLGIEARPYSTRKAMLIGEW